MSDHPSIFARVREFYHQCWNPERPSEEYRWNIANWQQTYVNRRIAAWIAYPLRNGPVSANHVTAAWVVMGIAGALLLVFDVYWLSVLAVILLYLSAVLDDVDGGLARHKRTFSIVGNFLDMVGHQIVYPMMFGALTLSMIRQEQPLWVICLGLLATTLQTPLTRMHDNAITLLAIQEMAQAKTTTTAAVAPPADQPQPGRPMSVIAQLPGFLYTECAQFYLLTVAVLLGAQKWFLIAYGATMPLVILPKFYVRARELAAIACDRDRLRAQIRPWWLDG